MKKDLSDARILIIDDQQVNIELIKNVLEMEGYNEIQELTDARLALSIIHSFQPHLILLDLMMPHISGIDILNKLKEENLLSETMPVMVLTADNNFATKRNALMAGAKDFLTKPLDLLEVSIRIKNLLSSVYLILQQQQQNDILEEKVNERTFELKHANKALLHAKNEAEKIAVQYQTLFNANKDALVLFQLSNNNNLHNFIHANNSAIQLFELDGADISTISLNNFLIENLQEKYIKPIYHLQENESYDTELIFTNKNQAQLILETKSIKIQLNNNLAILFIARDITEKKKYIETIETQNISLRKIAFTQSHVVRAPLSRIMGLVNLLTLNELEETPEFTKEDMLKGIIESANELDDIIKNITKITAETLTFEERKLG